VIKRLCIILAVAMISSCGLSPDMLPEIPVETEFFLLNLSRRWYFAAELQPVTASDQPNGDFQLSPLIPPGAVMRQRFLDLFPEDAYPGVGGCPDSLAIRAYVYKRVQDVTTDGVPIPLGEVTDSDIDPVPPASDELKPIPACEAIAVSTFTIILLDTDEGTGRVRSFQGTAAENSQEFKGQNIPAPPEVPELFGDQPIEGEVITASGEPVEGVGVLLRGRFRRMADDRELCPEEQNFTCFGDPIDVAITDASGAFRFDQPPGAYRVEVFADDFLFRPDRILIESPIDNVTFVAEPAK